MEPQVKYPWQSKTILLNAVLGILAAVALLVPGASVVKDFITAHAAEIGVAWSVLGVLLRLVTKDKVVLGD